MTTLDRAALQESMRRTAIQVGDDLYMMPLGLDEDGCEMFKPFSTRNPVAAAIHYRQADGSMGIVKDVAVCRVEMVAIGAGDDGCERYRARPVGGPLRASEVTYYRQPDGRYAAHSPDSSCG